MRDLKPETWIRRAEFLRRARDFFLKRDFLEVDTPCLADLPTPEPYLDPFRVALGKGEGWLITSPEFGLKRALGSGLSRIFEISHSFRAGEQGLWHTREFLMLEWYVAGFSMEDLIAQAEEFVMHCLGGNVPSCRISVEDWFRASFGHGFGRAELEKSASASGIAGAEGWSYEDLFYRIFLLAEEKLAPLGLVTLYGYPPEMAAFSRMFRGISRRFELYLSGVELANAFEEECDPAKLRERCVKMNEKRKLLGKAEARLDGHFIRALSGMNTPVSGIALGLDRLFAISCGGNSLEGFSPYDQEKAVES